MDICALTTEFPISKTSIIVCRYGMLPSRSEDAADGSFEFGVDSRARYSWFSGTLSLGREIFPSNIDLFHVAFVECLCLSVMIPDDSAGVQRPKEGK